MNILRGKTSEEILKDFLNSHNISESSWNRVVEQMNKSVKHENIRDIWRFTFIIFGIALILTLTIVGLTSNGTIEFPRIFKENITFIKKFINVFYGIFLYFVGVFLILFPFISSSSKYKVYED